MKAEIGADISKAAELLKSGQLVAIPTETVYGLAANAFDPEAVLKIFQVKERPAFDPLIVHVGRKEDVSNIVAELPKDADALMGLFWPGPLTLVLPKQSHVPDIVTSGIDTVGVRMPAHPLTLELLRSIEHPLAAPSANPFGYISPTNARHVAAQLGDKISYILDGGSCEIGVESTIIGWEDGTWVLYRAGGLPVEAIEEVIGKLVVAPQQDKPLAPGMLGSHYAPRKPLYIGDPPAWIARAPGERIGIISFTDRYPVEHCEVLSPSGDLAEAARNLFAAMRRLDAADIDLIVAGTFPSYGLGRAINDRLKRAASRP